MNQSKTEFYRDLGAQLSGLLGDERDRVANAASMSAFLFMTVPDLNWVGFYFMQRDELVVGPFQGKPACVRIAVGKGVCGTAVARRESILVDAGDLERLGDKIDQPWGQAAQHPSGAAAWEIRTIPIANSVKFERAIMVFHTRRGGR